MKSNFPFYCSSLCLLLTCLLRKAIFVTAGEKRVGSCVSRLIRVSNACFLGDKKKKIGSAVKGSFYVDGDSFYSPGVLIQMREAKVLGDRYLALQSKNVKCCCKAECKSFSLKCFTVAVQFLHHRFSLVKSVHICFKTHRSLLLPINRMQRGIYLLHAWGLSVVFPQQ